MNNIYKHGPRLALTRGSSGGSISTSSGNVAFIVEKTAHGYVSTDLPLAMFHTSTGWQKAEANESNTLATHVMVAISDVNHFTLAQAGRFKISGHGLTVNSYYFVSSTTSGKFVDIEPDEYSNPLLFIESINYIHILPFRPSISNQGLVPDVESFLNLNDTPDSYVGQKNKSVVVKTDETGLEFTTISNTTEFIALTDAPNSYTGQQNKLVAVNSSATGLVFITNSSPVVSSGHNVIIDAGSFIDVSSSTVLVDAGSFILWL